MRIGLLVLVATGCGARNPEPHAGIAPVTARPIEPAAAPTPDVPRATEEPWQPEEPTTPAGQPMRVAGREPERCSIRVTTTSILVDGDVMTKEAALDACKRRKGAVVAVEADADARWAPLKAGLDRAGIPILVRGAPAFEECSPNNPLAKGCM